MIYLLDAHPSHECRTVLRRFNVPAEKRFVSPRDRAEPGCPPQILVGYIFDARGSGDAGSEAVGFLDDAFGRGDIVPGDSGRGPAGRKTTSTGFGT
jgi:hypothetical protein